jgi:alkylation response protein AidB-like acyl-CoA dehydrogenase
MSVISLHGAAHARQSRPSGSDESLETRVLQIARELSAELAATATERERCNERPVGSAQKLRDTELVNLVIPAEFGGLGGGVALAVRVVAEICKGDASIGALLGYHFTNSGVARLFDLEGDAEAIDRQSAANRWLWGNVSQPFVRDFTATPDGDGFIVNGTKPWNTGPSLSDVTTVLAHRTDRKEILYAYIPTDRKGLTYHSDWDHLGLRLTDTVSITFDNVRIEPHEVFKSTVGPVVGFPPLYGAIGELYFAAFYLGSALGALEAAREYTRTRTRPWIASGVDEATKDPYILRDYGEMWTQVQAAESYIDQVAQLVEDGFRRRRSITQQERGELTVRAHSARAFISDVGLKVTPRIYDVMGARATANSYGFDRYWRDIRAHTLHDSLAYKLKSIGDFFLTGTAHEIPPFV